MRPVSYDFKRSFLRLSVILFIVISATIGIAVSYVIYAKVFSPHPYYFYNLNVIGVSIQKGNGVKVIGYIFNNHGIPINNAQINVNGTSYTTNASGFFELNLPNFHFKPITVSYNNQKIEFLPLPVFVNGSRYLSSAGYVQKSNYVFVIVNNNGKGTLILAADNPNNQKVYVSFLENSSSFNITNISFKYVGNVTNYINFYHLQTPHSIKYLVVQVRSPSPFAFQTVEEYSPDGYIIPTLISIMMVEISSFSFIFPAVMLYLAYILFAKPRDAGALKFILARPITRKELYINRYLGGVLTAIVSSLLLAFLIYATLSILLSSSGVLLPIDVPLILFVSTSGALIGFFSLVYMLPSFIRSGGIVLGISIFFFLFFQIGLSTIAEIIAYITGHISELSNILNEIYYLNPLGAEAFGTYYLEVQYGITSTVSSIHLPLVILSSIAWIVVPFIIGLIKFNKINI